MFQCDDGYYPSEVMNTICTSDGSWLPNPTETTCSMMMDKGIHYSIVIIGDWYILNLITVFNYLV